MSKGKKASYVPAKQSNTLTYVLGAIAVVVVAVVVIGGVLLLSKNQPSSAEEATGKLNAATPAFVAGRQDAPVTVDFFEDPMCPACGNLERTYGEQITKAITDGKIRARYHLLSFLNRQSSSGDYSDRAGGALVAVAKSTLADDQKQTAWLAAHTALFANQPTEGAQTDHTNPQLATIVGDGVKVAGVELPADVTAAISEGRYSTESATSAGAASQLMSDVGGTGTPTVVSNGQLVSVQDSEWLNKLIAD